MNRNEFENALIWDRQDEVLAEFDRLTEELESTRQIVNTERHNLIYKKHTQGGLNEKDSERFEYLKKKMCKWWTQEVVMLNEEKS